LKTVNLIIINFVAKEGPKLNSIMLVNGILIDLDAGMIKAYCAIQSGFHRLQVERRWGRCRMSW
jgi:hypothetical protein